MKTYLTSIFIALTLLCVGCQLSMAQHGSDEKEILLLNSYHKGFKWTDDITNSVLNYYSDSLKYRVFVDYMDSKRFQTPEYFQNLAHLYRYKFKDTHIDGIVCSDNNALDFYLKYGQEIWGKVPVVFCGINNPDDYRTKVDTTMVFGVEEKLDIKSNLSIALRLHPNTTEFIVIGDKTLLFPLFYKQFVQACDQLPRKINHQVIIIENADQLNDTLSHIDLKNKAIYLLSLYVNHNGIPKEMAVEARSALKNLHVPVYGDWDFLMPDLIMGGKILSGTDQGTEVARLLYLKLNGISCGKFSSPGKYTMIFDYNQLLKFGINTSMLPPNSRLLNKNLSIWEKYRLEISIIIAVIITLITTIIFLINSIIQRKRSEVELIESEYRLELALEGANQGLWDVNLKTNFIYINKEFAHLLGYASPKEVAVTMDNWMSFVFPDDLLVLKEAYLLHRTRKCSSMNSEVRMIKRNGENIWVSLHGKITEWQNDNPIRVTGSLLNITEQKEFEDQLKWAKNKAEESDRLKSSFLANMSHEIRTPMNVIVGFSDLVNSGAVSDLERQTYLSQIKHSSESLLTIINDIIDISKIESGQMNIHKELFDLNNLLNKVTNTAEALIIRQGKQIKFITSLTTDSPRFIISDPQRLEQVLLNLVTNAIKFTKQGQVELGFKDDSFHSLLFFVKDTGIGIAPEHLKVVFERFRQGDESMAKQFGGTGLGLTICKNLVGLLGGSIWVESEMGKGSTFSFSILKT